MKTNKYGGPLTMKNESLPWKFHNLELFNQNGEMICTLHSWEDGELIVKAVNNFEALLEASKAYLDRVKPYYAEDKPLMRALEQAISNAEKHV